MCRELALGPLAFTPTGEALRDPHLQAKVQAQKGEIICPWCQVVKVHGLQLKSSPQAQD